ncbi:MAG: ferrochelatase [Alphaproteobacteria bacterium]
MANREFLVIIVLSFYIVYKKNSVKKIAVVLYNLGGPCCGAQVKPFLFNLFYDRAIISLPNPFRYFLANLISSSRREKAQGIYNQIGGGSPILAETYAQSIALKQALSSHAEYHFETFVYMRYAYPFFEDVASSVQKFDPDEIILLPLYPQYSTTTTKSSIDLWQENATIFGFDDKTKYITSYETEPNFVKSYAELLKPQLDEAKKLGRPIVLFSAHGIPLNRIQKGDPYQKHVEASVAEILKHLNQDEFDYLVCYQSKVGPLKWLAPPTEDCILEAAKENRSIVVVPVSFVSEHSETLVELDIQYKELALENGAKGYFRVPASGIEPHYIECLKQVVLKEIA